MIAHALTIVKKELSDHLNPGPDSSSVDSVALGNLSEGVAAVNSDGSSLRELVCISVVNITEEKTLKNITNTHRNLSTLTTVYENPPVFLNLLVLITATHADYTQALLQISRVIRFFQSRNVFTHENVNPGSITAGSFNDTDRLETFKLIFDLYSPTLEESNHMWGTLGGKQYPYVMYRMRMLELSLRSVQAEGGLVSEIVTDLHIKKAAGSENG